MPTWLIYSFGVYSSAARIRCSYSLTKNDHSIWCYNVNSVIIMFFLWKMAKNYHLENHLGGILAWTDNILLVSNPTDPKNYFMSSRTIYRKLTKISLKQNCAIIYLSYQVKEHKLLISCWVLDILGQGVMSLF